MQNARPDAFLPQRYNGSDPALAAPHWYSFIDYCEMHQLNDQQKLARFKVTLQGRARNWLQGKVFPNVDAMRNAFIEHYSGIYSREGGKTLWKGLTLQDGESIEAFVARIKPLAERLNKDDDDVQEKIYDVLPDELSEQVEMAGGTLANTIQLAQRRLDIKAKKKATVKEVTFRAAEADVRQQMEYLALTNDRYSDRGRSPRRSGRSPERWGRRRSQDRWRNFSKDRSYSKDRSSTSEYSKERSYTPDRRRGRSSGRSRTPDRRRGRSATPGGVCDYCGKGGHAYRDCYTLENDMAEKRSKRLAEDKDKKDFQ